MTPAEEIAEKHAEIAKLEAQQEMTAKFAKPASQSGTPRVEPMLDDGLVSTNKNGSTFCQWMQVESNQYIASGPTIKSLKSGMYALRWWKGNPSVEFRPSNVDEIFVFPGSIAEEILQEVDEFWTKADRFALHKLLHRRGFLLHGPQGTGKTSIIQLIVQDIIKRKGLVLMCNDDPSLLNIFLPQFRQIEPERPIVCIYEDIDALIETWGEERILSLLDGENQIDHVLNVATSNHPDKLDYRLTNRPRRFDKIIRAGNVSEDMRRLYFVKKQVGLSDSAALDMWVAESEGFSFAALADMVISVKILDQDFEKTVNRLRIMMKNKAVKGDNQPVGFGNDPQVDCD